MKQTKWIIIAVCIIAVITLVFCPGYVEAEGLVPYGTSPLQRLENGMGGMLSIYSVYANNSQNPIAAISVRTEVIYDSSQGIFGAFYFATEIYIEVVKDKGSDIYRVDGCKVTTSMSGSGQRVNATVSDVGGISIYDGHHFNTDYATIIPSIRNTSISGATYNCGAHENDKDVVFSFIERYNRLGTGNYTYSVNLSDIVITGVFLAPDYTADNTENIQHTMSFTDTLQNFSISGSLNGVSGADDIVAIYKMGW